MLQFDGFGSEKKGLRATSSCRARKIQSSEKNQPLGQAQTSDGPSGRKWSDMEGGT